MSERDEYGPSTFEQACKKADAEAAKRPRPVLADIPLVKTHGVPSAAALQREYERTLGRRGREREPSRSTLDGAAQLMQQCESELAASIAKATDGDLLAQAIESVRPLLLNGPTKIRIRLLWSAARSARKLAAEARIEHAFLQLAIEVGLINERGYWLGNDVRADIRRHGREDVVHVIRWALRDWNPFERLR
jgi:hypothetical protein